MSSKAEIATSALLDVGGQEVSDIDNEKSKEASLVRNSWDILRDEVLGKFEWNFAKKWKALAQDASFAMVDEQWEYAYTMPSDYIRISQEENDAVYEIRENRIYSNDDELKIEYIARIEDTTKWPVWFVNAFVARLRAKFAIPLAKKGTKTLDWYQIYLLELQGAMTLDAQQNSRSEESKGNHTVNNDTWIEAAQI